MGNGCLDVNAYMEIKPENFHQFLTFSLSYQFLLVVHFWKLVAHTNIDLSNTTRIFCFDGF